MDCFSARADYFARRYIKTERALKARKCGLESRQDFQSIVIACTFLLELEEIAFDIETTLIEEQRV